MNIEKILQKGIDNLNDEERKENYKNFIGGIEYLKEKILPYLEEKDKEIKRLNNKVEELMTLYTTERNVKEDYKAIINELEKYIAIKMNSFGVCNASDIYYKLQELKGSDKE